MPHPRRYRPALLTLVLVLPFSACAGADVESGNGWQYTSETNGDLTTVVTTAGSSWGVEASIREELSIGVEEGDDPYMFAFISSVWPGDDLIIVADYRLPAVRAFDLEGNFLFDVGRPGQGPGEYEGPMAAAVLPDGRIAVVEGTKVHLYAHDGEYLEQWTEEPTGMRFFAPGSVAFGLDGSVYRRTPILSSDGGRVDFSHLKWGMKPLSADGPGQIIAAPETDYEAPTVSVRAGDNFAAMQVPFAPQHQWTMTPTGDFVAGVPSDYSFSIYHADGRESRVERYWEPVPVTDAEIKISMRSQRIVINGATPEIDWGDVEMPTTKPAYTGLFATRDGRIVVVRPGPATVDPACLGPDADTSPGTIAGCVDGITWADVFETDGLFIGSFQVPSGAQLMSPYFDGDVFWTGSQDEHGTVTVKKYRVVPPPGADTN